MQRKKRSQDMRRVIFLYIFCLLVSSHQEEAMGAYNLYDRNRYHYDFPIKRNGRVINPQPEEPKQLGFPPEVRYETDLIEGEKECYYYLDEY